MNYPGIDSVSRVLQMPSSEPTRLASPQLPLQLSAAWCHCCDLVLHSSAEACPPKGMLVSGCRGASPLWTEVIAFLAHAYRVTLCQDTNWLQEPPDRTASRISLLIDLESPSPCLIHDPCIWVGHSVIKLVEHKDLIA